MSVRIASLLAATAARGGRASLLAALRPRCCATRSLRCAAAAMALPPGARVPAPVPPPPAPAAPVKVALCQLATGADKAANIAAATAAVRDAAAAGAKLVVLPEMWNCPYGARQQRAASGHVHAV
jgi:omega-amidase